MLQLDRQKEMIERLTAYNAVNLPALKVTYMGWLTRLRDNQQHGSVVVELETPD